MPQTDEAAIGDPTASASATQERGGEGATGEGCNSVVQATRFSGRMAEEGHRGLVLHALEGKSAWHRKIGKVITRDKVKIGCSLNESGTLLAAHLTLHNDWKLIKLAKECNFPRGFCIIVDTASQTLVGQGTFYPKFANDDRNEEFSSKDFGGVNRISCFLKYSGSAGIISIIRDTSGAVVGWTGSSKNSCNHCDHEDGGISYPSETISSFSRYATDRFMQWCHKRHVLSLGLEVFIDRDQTHGYGYTSSGCIVTAMCVGGGHDGQPVYVPPQDLYEACCEVGLPTDAPICIEGSSDIRRFVECLSEVRDLLTLGAIRAVLRDRCLVTLETLHDSLIDSQIVEGFVIRRWKNDSEVQAVKFKMWLYQMVTQVLRPACKSSATKGFGDARGSVTSMKVLSGEIKPEVLQRIKEEMRRWCVASDASTQKLCRWVIQTAAKACLPEGHEQLKWSEGHGPAFPAGAHVPEGCVARDPVRAYWITLGDYAVERLISVMDSSGWNVQEAAAALNSFR